MLFVSKSIKNKRLSPKVMAQAETYSPFPCPTFRMRLTKSPEGYLKAHTALALSNTYTMESEMHTVLMSPMKLPQVFKAMVSILDMTAGRGMILFS